MRDLSPRDWRAGKTVLVTAAHAIGSIAVIRSLGGAGYRVIACAQDRRALGFRSRHCQLAVTEPDAEGEPFFRWLDDLIQNQGIDLIIPSEGFLLKLRQRFSAYVRLMPVPENERLVYAGLSKVDLFEICREHGLTDNLPPFWLVGETDSCPSVQDLSHLNWPVFLKLDAKYAVLGGGGEVVKCADFAAFKTAFESFRPAYRKMLIQGYVTGAGVGAFLGRWQGRELGCFMHRRLHEVPHTGGASSYRVSWQNEAVMADARRRMTCLGWDGVGMFEYRWDTETGRFYLLEFNSRFWGSLHLALFAGVDFPGLLADAFFGRPRPVPTPAANVRARLTFPGEVGYLLSYARDQNIPSGLRLRALFEFFSLGLRPGVRSDLWYPGDRWLYVLSAWRTFRNLLR